jgi:hypothetical protein
MAWSFVALQERTMCSNLPSTGTAVLTTGGYLPHLHAFKGIKFVVSGNNGSLHSQSRAIREREIQTFQGKQQSKPNATVSCNAY